VGIVGWLLAAPEVHAYPTSVIFAPNGEVKRLGEVGLFAYTALQAAPRAIPGSTWFGFDVGLVPRIPFRENGVSFGGLEMGIDIFNADLSGTASAFVKPLLNLKLQLLTEYRWVPSVGVGVMGIAFTRPARSMDLVYGAATKTLQIKERSYGRFTLGLGWVGSHNPDPDGASSPVFRDTWPFHSSSRLMLLAGYETPRWGAFSFAVDYVGGQSEISSTNIAANFVPLEGTTLSIGGYFGNDWDVFTAGAFTYVYIDWNVLRFFARKRR